MRGFYYRFLGIVRRGRSGEEHGRWWHAPGRNVADRADLNYGFLSPGRHFSRLHFCKKKEEEEEINLKYSRHVYGTRCYPYARHFRGHWLKRL